VQVGRVLERHDVLALAARIAEFADGGRGVLQKAGAIGTIAPGTRDDAGPVPRADPGLVGLDQQIERGRIDIPFLGQDRFQRADPQLGLGQF
jgi:hypothetical protein